MPATTSSIDWHLWLEIGHYVFLPVAIFLFNRIVNAFDVKMDKAIQMALTARFKEERESLHTYIDSSNSKLLADINGTYVRSRDQSRDFQAIEARLTRIEAHLMK